MLEWENILHWGSSLGWGSILLPLHWENNLECQVLGSTPHLHRLGSNQVCWGSNWEKWGGLGSSWEK